MRRRGSFALARTAVGALLGCALGIAQAGETIAVVAVAEPPVGPDADLAEMTHQLRAACRDRVGDVLDVASMQARFRGLSDGATLSELDRAYGGALAVYQNGEFESALRTLQAIVRDLEALPEGREPWQQWIRATLRLAHAALTVGRPEEADAALTRLLRIEPNYRADPDQYSPTYRRRMDEVRGRIQATPHRRVTVVANGRQGTLFVDGRPSGTTPMTLFLPAGRYRIGGASAALRVPSFQVDVTDEDRTVVLDFETSEAIRLTSGPGLALPLARRAEGLIRAGAWLDVDKLIVVARGFEGDAQFLVGGIYDVRRGALQREGSVRAAGGSVPTANIGALAAFLLTGAQQREVRARTPELASADRIAPAPPAPPAAAPPTPAAVADLRPSPSAARPPLAPSDGPGRSPATPWLSPRPWMRPAAWVAGGAAIAFAGLAVNRRLAANEAYADARALLGPGGVLVSASDLPRYRTLTSDGDAAARATWIAAGTSAAFAAAAGLLGWTSAQPVGGIISF